MGITDKKQLIKSQKIWKITKSRNMIAFSKKKNN